MDMKAIRILKFVLIFAVTSVAISVQGQRVKYKDLYPRLTGLDEDKAITVLNEYLFNDRDHPNANLRLALLYARKYKETDVLKEHFAKRTKLMFVKAMALVDEKEVKKNKDYFTNVIDTIFEKKVDFSLIANRMNNEYFYVNAFLEKLPPIYYNFTKSVISYDRAKILYHGIIRKYRNMKELYLLFDESLDQQLIALKQSYDSTLIYLNNYRALTKEYNIGYNQVYVVRKIKTYRLDGLITQPNFLVEQIELWNYGQWVDDIHSMMGSAIADLRKDLANNENLLNKSLANISQSNILEATGFVKVDKELIFNLNKYDYLNPLVPLLQYKQNKQDFILKERYLNSLDTSSTIGLNGRLTYFTEMLYETKAADSSLSEIKKRINKEQIKRHEDFLKNYYNGVEGLENYLSAEKSYIKNLFTSVVEKIRTSVIPELKTSDSLKSKIQYKRQALPLYVVDNPYNSILINEFRTTHVKLNSDNSMYIAGVNILDKKINNVEVFVAKISPGKKIEWIKNYDVEIDSAGADANHKVGAMEVTKEGCVVVINSFGFDSATVVNSFVYLDEKGSEIITKRLENDLFPRFINYDENSSSFVLTFWGEELDTSIEEKYYMTAINLTSGGEQLWTSQFSLAGQINNVINLHDGYAFFGNFTYLKDHEGKEYKVNVGEGSTNPFMAKIDFKGNVKKVMPISRNTSLYFTDLYKVNDKNISLFGELGNLYQEQVSSNPFFIITNSKLEIIYSSLE